ncbi:hypothetical protein SSX86_001838 [Deinandra increscens subsp. villosa]|uniref:Uncharacterized protein n=1 Tax=Deinandra increscens subsp. villosa TaxID=3103831 RepID=A0AAP0DVP4_9ASTR
MFGKKHGHGFPVSAIGDSPKIKGILTPLLDDNKRRLKSLNPSFLRLSSAPSNPHQRPQRQLYLILPFYASDHHKWRRLYRRYIYCTITLLLAVSVYVLWPSDPHLKVVSSAPLLVNQQ